MIIGASSGSLERDVRVRDNNTEGIKVNRYRGGGRGGDHRSLLRFPGMRREG